MTWADLERSSRPQVDFPSRLPGLPTPQAVAQNTTPSPVRRASTPSGTRKQISLNSIDLSLPRVLLPLRLSTSSDVGLNKSSYRQSGALWAPHWCRAEPERQAHSCKLWSKTKRCQNTHFVEISINCRILASTFWRPRQLPSLSMRKSTTAYECNDVDMPIYILYRLYLAGIGLK